MVDGGWYSMPRPSCYNPGKGHITHRTGGWMGKRTGLDGCRNSYFHWNSNPRLSSPQSVTILTTHFNYKGSQYVILTTKLNHWLSLQISYMKIPYPYGKWNREGGMSHDMLRLWSPVFHGFPCHKCDSVSMFCNSTSNLLLCFGVFWYCSWTQAQSPYTGILICVCGLMRTDKATLTCRTKTVQLWKTLTFTWKRNILCKFWNNRFLKVHIYICTHTYIYTYIYIYTSVCDSEQTVVILSFCNQQG